jgi:hypothetical protein
MFLISAPQVKHRKFALEFPFAKTERIACGFNPVYASYLRVQRFLPRVHGGHSGESGFVFSFDACARVLRARVL